LTADPDRYQLPDQDVLNLLFSGKWLSLSLGFNALTSYYLLSDQQLTPDIRECLLNPKIVHFSGPIKPWHTGFIHPFMSHYWSYRNKTPYRLRQKKNYKFQLTPLIARTKNEFVVFKRAANLFAIRILVWITPRSLKNAIPKGLKDKVIDKLLR
jgi:lipopolysaccharide biosynthesis glycosyltransferase